MEDFVAVLKKYPNDKFESYDERFNGKSFTGYKLEPQNSHLASIEIIRLKSLLTEVIGANIRE